MIDDGLGWLVGLGRSLANDCQEIAADIVERNFASGTSLDPVVEDLFIQAALVSTVAVGGWLAGDPPGGRPQSRVGGN